MPDSPPPLKSVAAILDSLDVAVCAVDAGDGTLLWNDTFLRFFPEHAGHIYEGEPYCENVRRIYMHRLRPDELPQIDQYVDAAMARLHSVRRTATFQHRGRWLHGTSMAVPGLGQLRCWAQTLSVQPGEQGVPSDPAADSGADAGATDWFTRLALFEQVADGVMLVDAGNRVRWANEHFIVLYGLGASASPLGMTFLELYAMSWAGHEAAEPGRHALGQRTLAGNAACAGAPYELPLPGGRWVRVVEQRGANGVGYLAHVDITQIKRREQESIEQAELLKTTLSSISQGIFMIGMDGRLITWNARIRELLDLPEELLAQRPTLQQITQFQLDRGDFGSKEVRVQGHARSYVAAAGSGPIPQRYLRTTKDGQVLEVITQTLENGGMVRTFTDVTGYVRAQEEIQRLNNELEDRVRQRTAQLEAANEELEAFAYSIAHDLRQPLTSIDGFSSLLGDQLPEGSPQKAKHFVTRIRAGIRQMSALTEGLLSLAHLSRTKLNWAHCDIGAVAGDILAQHAAREPHRKVDVHVQPGMQVRCEPALMRQVLENLLGNAWKFTAHQPDAQIDVGQLADTDGPVYFVRDNGAGFEMAYADKLFRPFQRLHSPGEFAGTGIGLAIVHRIVTRHGGRIWADSTPGKGATFYFTLGHEPA